MLTDGRIWVDELAPWNGISNICSLRTIGQSDSISCGGSCEQRNHGHTMRPQRWWQNEVISLCIVLQILKDAWLLLGCCDNAVWRALPCFHRTHVDSVVNGSDTLDLRRSEPCWTGLSIFRPKKPFWLFKEPHKTQLAMTQLEKGQLNIQSF